MLSDREQEFIEHIYEKYARVLFTCSLSLLRSLPDASSIAEECVQETFETAMRKMKILERHPASEAWLKAVCRNITLSRRRKIFNRLRITGQGVLCGDNIADVHSRIDEWIEQHELQQKKQQLIDTLTEEEKAVFHAYFEREMSLKESAEILGLSETAVRGSVQRIRTKAARISILLSLFLWIVSLF